MSQLNSLYKIMGEPAVGTTLNTCWVSVWNTLAPTTVSIWTKHAIIFLSRYLCLGPDLCLKDFLELQVNIPVLWLPLGDTV